ncbi:MAG: ABC transporter permease subunit [Candidatus Binatia bacterium]
MSARGPVAGAPEAIASAVSARAPALARARRRVFVDRLAAVLVRAGGLGIIASILAILIFIVAEVAPLLSSPRVSTERILPLGNDGTVRAMVADEYGTHVATLDLSGAVRVLRLDDGAQVANASLLPTGAALVAAQVPPDSGLLTGASADGRVLLAPVHWHTRFVGDRRVLTPALPEAVAIQVDPAGHPVPVYAAQLSASGAAAVAAQLADGTLVVIRQTKKENAFTGEVTEARERASAPVAQRLTALAMDPEQRNVYGADQGGNLFWWTLDGSRIGEPQVIAAGPQVTALSLLLGGRSLVVGQADGSLSVWFTAPGAGGSRLTRVRDFPRRPAPITAIAPSQRDKGFLAQDAAGGLGLYYSTSHRTLWTGAGPFAGTALALAPRGGAGYVAGDRELAVLDIHNPHPEVSFGALFGRVWYEGYAGPGYVWQSSGANDAFEPKISLTPLLIGTLKGTVYSLIIAIPLAVLGAMYLSQFMHPRLKALIKPAVEIMAALPSVVLGFLAGLWLAPRVQRMFPALLLMAILFPLLSIAAGALWQAVPRRWRARLPMGSEVALMVLALAVGLAACIALQAPVERAVFGGNFQAWLLHATGFTYDQRNALIVGMAMGFAVIPIIFAIAEDAFSNVPRDLVSGSLALGASRWQTVTRIVLPTASPGIFSAIMVGFGRAVGETMIVLMATGNTPILDWSPFTGFRTLSANIAVEIPEAPIGDTLYRVLFLAALLLFVVTFIINTAAELVRVRLRRRYAQL